MKTGKFFLEKDADVDGLFCESMEKLFESTSVGPGGSLEVYEVTVRRLGNFKSRVTFDAQPEAAQEQEIVDYRSHMVQD